MPEQPHAGRPVSSRSVPETRRFVPTLTEVVHVPPPQVPPSEPHRPESELLVSSRDSASTVTKPEPDEALVARACASVMHAMDDHIRDAVTHALQTQQMLLVQTLRSELASQVEALVRDAVLGKTVQAARQIGDGCIQTTD